MPFKGTESWDKLRKANKPLLPEVGRGKKEGRKGHNEKYKRKREREKNERRKRAALSRASFVLV